jgi:acyl-CoA dehydrogenase
MARVGAGGFNASLLIHGIGLPPVIRLGTDEMKQRVATQVLAGEKIHRLAITEPDGGSDVANIKTTAKLDCDHYILNGTKTYITSGVRGDFFTVAVRTGGPGAKGISLLLVERDMAGFQRTPLKKWAGGVRTLHSFISIMCVCPKKI